MNSVLLITIGTLVMFSAIGYVLFLAITRKVNHSVYWQKRQIRNKESDQLKKDISLHESELTGYKKLITLTVQCRNLLQKISQEVGSLFIQQSEKNLIQTIELHVLDVFRNENHQLTQRLENLEKDREIKLTDDSSAYLARLTGCMHKNQDIIGNIFSSLTSPGRTTGDSSHVEQELSENYNEIVELHNWIISHFQQIFTELQQL